jgi:hypothetical protein
VLKFWSDVVVEALRRSLEVMGKSWSEIFRTLFVVLIVAALNMRRYGWPKTRHDIKAKLRETFPSGAGILGLLFVLILLFQAAAVSFERYDAQSKQITKQQQDIKALQTKYDSLTLPDFHPEIVNLYLIPAGDPENVVVGVYSRVKNLGADSSIIGLGLYVRFDDGRSLEGIKAAGVSEPDKVRIGLMRDQQGAIESFSAKNYWLEEMSDVLPHNGSRDGVLLALVKNTTKEEILQKHATIRFEVKDIRDRIVPVDHYVVGDGYEGRDPNNIALSDLQRPLNPSPKRK